jgi:hypothetical protein
LRKAGVRYIEVTDEHSKEDIDREVSRLAGDERARLMKVADDMTMVDAP